MAIRIDRIIDNFNAILQYSSSDSGFERFSYSKEDIMAREFLMKKFKELQLEVCTDGIGNIYASYNPAHSKEKPVFIGSHIDTVPDGGQFDGLTGVLSSLEVLTAMSETNFLPRIPITLAVFAEEEGSNFQITMMGSKFFAKLLDFRDLCLLEDSEGNSALEIMKKAGFHPSEDNIITYEDISPASMIELHVEQGNILDSCGISIGIVEGIVGSRTFEIEMRGQSNHAGTTPMNMRKDPLVPAAGVIYEIPSLPQESGSHLAVATVGKVIVDPCSANVIPDSVKFWVDLRDYKEFGIENMSLQLTRLVKKYSEKFGVDFSINQVSDSPSIKSDKSLVNTINKVANKMGIESKLMHSGAVHDCAMVAQHAKIAMIFVPSKDGISHNRREFTEYSDIEKGTQVLYESLLEITE